MKIKFILFIVLLILNNVSKADTVDVIINGKSYTCSDSGSGSLAGVHSNCVCVPYPNASPKGAGLVYVSIDTATGAKTYTTIKSWYEGENDSLFACAEYKKTLSLCQ